MFCQRSDLGRYAYEDRMPESMRQLLQEQREIRNDGEFERASSRVLNLAIDERLKVLYKF